MKPLFIILIFITVFNVPLVYAQPNEWDVPTTEILISHNKQNYSDHQQAAANQLVSQGTVSWWKSTTNTFNNLTNSIDKRLTSFYIITADAGTVYNIATRLSEMASLEEKSIELSYQYPFTVPILISDEDKIISSGTSLFEYLSLMVISYDAISKMQVSARTIIYREITDQLNILSAECNSLYLFMERVQLSDLLKNGKAYQLINKDDQLVKDILKNMK
jgi:hypothetical protein